MEDTLKLILFYSYMFVLLPHVQFTAFLVFIVCDYNNVIIMDGEQAHEVCLLILLFTYPPSVNRLQIHKGNI